MKVILFDATGGTGGQVIQQACEAGHEVTVVVRDATRLTRSHLRLTVLQADVIDPTAIAPAIAGSDAVVSVLGTILRHSFADMRRTEDLVRASGLE